MATQWQTVLLFFNQEPFGQTDPEFDLDPRVYVFTLRSCGCSSGSWSRRCRSRGRSVISAHVDGGHRIHERGISTTRAAAYGVDRRGVVLACRRRVPARPLLHSISGSGKWTGALYTDVNAVIPPRGHPGRGRAARGHPSWWPG
ncbi:UPF0182 family protein [Kocuria rhizophila]|nr:UPF0182 family protein [Kocuria rhizophila]